MSRRNKRASMREGPLSDLFRSTSDDAPADPPEAPRYGREDPAEARRSKPPEEVPHEPAPVPPRSPAMPRRPCALSEEPTSESATRRRIRDSARAAETGLLRGAAAARASARDRAVVENPRYGREEPAYEPPGSGEPHQPVIKVVGVGGAGVNAVNRMVDARIPGVEFMAVNTDLQSLQLCVADVTVHIGDEQTRGLGAGADPEVGHRSAFEEQDKIKRLLKGSDMVFVAAGAGGGTGSGAAPVVARLAREVGALTVGIVTKPFSFEGSRRGDQADKGIEELAAEVDTLIVVPNDRLLEVLDQQTSMVEAFQVADDVLRQGVQGISDLVTLPAVINLDFADVRTIMSDAGRALLGIGMAHGDDRAILAAEKAISSPLLETSMEGARSILLSITGGSDLSLVEVSRGGQGGRRGRPPRRQHHLRRQRRRRALRPDLGHRRRHPLRRPPAAAAPRRRADDPPHQRRRGRGRPPQRQGGELGIDVPEFLPG